MITLSCPAKVNLFLAILGRDSSGYHEIDTVFVRVTELVDTLEIEPAQELTFECEAVPGHSNTVLKAIRLLEQKTGRNFPYKIRLIKNIPIQSGLGGGSSDAASIMLFLNDRENLGLSQAQLAKLGAQIGMDVPFFLSGYEVARGTHYGEIITPLPSLPKNLNITIEPTKHEVSTPEAYALWDRFVQRRKTQSTFSQKPMLAKLIAALKSQDAKAIIAAMHNDFELILPERGPYGFGRILAGSGGATAVFDVDDKS